MKNFWTHETANRRAEAEGMGSADWIMAKQREFEANTGVKWSVANQQGGYMLHPIDDGVPVMHPVPRDTVQKIKAAYEAADKDFTGYVTYLQINEDKGFDLKGLMAAIKGMEKDGLARRTVNRMGKGYAFKLV
jgi:hypothetical protein